MKKHLTTKDISAYLDGEHKRPGEVQKHLQQCADCAREHTALAKVSAHVRALPAPEVTHGFAARVLRAIEGAAPARRITPIRWLAPLAAACALVAIVGYNALNAPQGLPGIVPQQIAIEESGSSEFKDDLSDIQLAFLSEDIARPVPGELFTGTDYNKTLLSFDDDEKDVLIQLLRSALSDEQML